jgi:hypothetical protein
MKAGAAQRADVDAVKRIGCAGAHDINRRGGRASVLEIPERAV